MAYVRTGGETQMGDATGLGHSQAACCAECATGKACVGTPAAQGDLFEFKMSSILPWLLVLGIGYIVLKTPESHGHLAGTARSELSRARGAASRGLARYRVKRKLGRYHRRR